MNAVPGGVLGSGTILEGAAAVAVAIGTGVSELVIVGVEVGAGVGIPESGMISSCADGVPAGTTVRGMRVGPLAGGPNSGSDDLSVPHEASATRAVPTKNQTEMLLYLCNFILPRQHLVAYESGTFAVPWNDSTPESP